MEKHQRWITYQCTRCGASFPQKSNYKAHISRKKMCNPSDSNVIPTLQNARITQVSHTPTGNHVATTPVTSVTATPTVNVVGSHNSLGPIEQNVTTNNHITNTNIYCFGKEDMSFITPELVKNLLETSTDPERTLQNLVMLVHFNPFRPENMNVYTRKDEDVYGSQVFKNKWIKNLKTTSVAREIASNVAKAFLSNMSSLIDPKLQEKILEFKNVFDDVHNDWDVGDSLAECLPEFSSVVPQRHPEVLENVTSRSGS